MTPDPTRLPRHVAIIMDGNGRWAQRRGLPRVEGHRRGAKSVKEVVRAAREVGLRALTLYAFSSQNWDRPPDEVATLMQLLRDYVIEERAEIMENGIRLIAIGEVDRLPDFVRVPLEDLMRDSAGNRAMTLCLALSYGGRESIVAAARALCEAAARGTLQPKELTEARFSAALQTGGLPQLDLLIRTSGEERLSNFLLWEAAYAELYFTDTFWPDFGRDHLLLALKSFDGRERRFGLTREQIRSAG
jgi:undecaprenyl diphosphate synthase